VTFGRGSEVEPFYIGVNDFLASDTVYHTQLLGLIRSMNSPSRREGSSCYSLLALGARLLAVACTMLVLEALAH
tara:strand:+ start:1973 stop:2194 length:222 start_codon:yes stop_codon:yes gene_type:complete